MSSEFPPCVCVCAAGGITFDERHDLELEGNPDRLGEHKDGAAGLRDEVEVELHVLSFDAADEFVAAVFPLCASSRLLPRLLYPRLLRTPPLLAARPRDF